MKEENINTLLTELYHKINGLGNTYEKDGITYIDYGKGCFGQYGVMRGVEIAFGFDTIIRHRPDFLKDELPENRLVIEIW